MGSSLQGRRVLLTGVSRGIGLSIARLFSSEGAELLGVARSPERLSSVTRELSASGRFTSVCVDVTSPEAPAKLAEAVQARWGALDLLINNAGVQLSGEAKTFAQESPAQLHDSMEVNLWAPHRLTLALLPALARGREPRVINVSSGAGMLAALEEPGLASYRLSKWALNGMTVLFAAQLRGKVAVNAFDPGWVKTDLGGPAAPGTPEESARGALALATAPFAETGKFWKDGHQISF